MRQETARKNELLGQIQAQSGEINQHMQRIDQLIRESGKGAA